MPNTPTILSGAKAPSDFFKLARKAVRGRMARMPALIAVPLASLLLATAAHAIPQVSSLVHVPNIVPAGGTVTSTVTIAETDSLPIGAPGTSFTYTVPANSIYMGTGAVPVGSCSSTVNVGEAGPGTVTCSGITLAANQTRDFELRLRTVSQGTLSVTATPAGGGASETKTITVNQGADVAVVITAPATASSGATVPIAFTLTNNGPDASSGSTLTYNIPTGLSVSGSGLPSGCSIAGSQLTCNVGVLSLNGSRTITVNGVVTGAAGSTITHQPAIAPAGSIGDGVPANNNATANTTVTAGTVLSMTKTHNGGQLLVGQRFNFTLTPRYSGSAPTGVTVTDTLPANFQINVPVTAGPEWTCSVSGQTVSCARTDVGGAGGANQSLGNIVVPVTAVTAGTGVVNEATVNAAGPVATSATGSVPADVATSATDFRADKRRGWPQNNVPIDQPFDYQVGATNLGGTRLLAGSTVNLVDDLPAGVRINGFDSGSYTCTITKGGSTVTTPVDGPATVNCTRTLASDIPVDTSSGGSARNAGFVTVNVTIPAVPAGNAPIVNSMCVNVALPASAPTAGADPDANTGNDCVNLGTGVDDSANYADVKVLKRVVGIGNSAGNRQTAGQAITWEIEVVNSGPSVAQNVAVSDRFLQVVGTPAVSQTANAATFAGACTLPPPSGGAGDTSLANCNITQLPVCRASTDPVTAVPLCPVISVQARHFGDGASAADNSFQIANKASAIAAMPADPVLDDAGVTNSGSATGFFNAVADVTVTKTASPSSVPVGQVLTYTLTARNRPCRRTASAAPTTCR